MQISTGKYILVLFWNTREIENTMCVLKGEKIF